jgi:hypothetical protein
VNQGDWTTPVLLYEDALTTLGTSHDAWIIELWWDERAGEYSERSWCWTWDAAVGRIVCECDIDTGGRA